MNTIGGASQGAYHPTVSMHQNQQMFGTNGNNQSMGSQGRSNAPPP